MARLNDLPSDLRPETQTVIETEAGGRVTDIYGAPWTLSADSLLAAADRSTHEALLRIARRAKPA